MRLIDADALIAQLIKHNATEKMTVAYFANMAIDAPTVDAFPVVHGQWKAVTDDGEEYKRICSCCGKEAPFDELEGVYLIYPHCPWCGAKMGVGQE